MIPVSAALNPDPVTVTEVPETPVFGLMEMLALTMKLASVTLAACVLERLTPILCVPDADVGTVKVVLHVPWEVAVMPVVK